MKNRILFQSVIICTVAVYLAVALQPKPLNKQEYVDNIGSEVREKRATAAKPGFFRTLFSVIYEQWDDTRKTSASIGKVINDNFLPENQKISPTTVSPNSNVSTTEDNRITRTELQKILLRNLRGLRNLFQVELRDALKQSEKTSGDFRKNVTREISKFL